LEVNISPIYHYFSLQAISAKEKNISTTSVSSRFAAMNLDDLRQGNRSIQCHLYRQPSTALLI
jgi:hypothetical protein